MYGLINVALSKYTFACKLTWKIRTGVWKYHLGTSLCFRLSASEVMQKGTNRLVHGLCAYGNCLVELNLPSLKYRRHRSDMIMIYQLLHHNLNADLSDLLTLNTFFITWGHNLKLYKPRTSSRVRSSFFAVRDIIIISYCAKPLKECGAQHYSKMWLQMCALYECM